MSRHSIPYSACSSSGYVRTRERSPLSSTRTVAASTGQKPIVKIDNFSFNALPLQPFKAGSTVRWTNRDDIPHTVVSERQALQVEGDGHGRTIRRIRLTSRGPISTSARFIRR